MVVSIPFVGYVIGMRKRSIQWVTLGSVTDFSPGETRLVTFDNPIRQPWDGLAAHIGVYVRLESDKKQRRSDFWCSPPTVLTWVVRSPGFPNQVYSCVLVMAVFITRPVSVHRDHPHVGFFAASGGSAMGNWRFRLRITRPCKTPWRNQHNRVISDSLPWHTWKKGAFDGPLVEGTG